MPLPFRTDLDAAQLRAAARRSKASSARSHSVVPRGPRTKSAAKPNKPPSTQKPAASTAERTAAVRKDELREQVAKLEATIDTLRTKAAAARKDARTRHARDNRER